jgi:uncharacterized protein (TIGR02145 family)
MRKLTLIFAIILMISCEQQSIPVAKLTTYPAIGDSTIFFELNAGQSADSKCYANALTYRWDFDDDQSWDTHFSHEAVVVRLFSKPGTYVISVEVMNMDGNSSIARDTIEVYGRNQDVSTLTDTRDGQVYRIVKLNDRWWMAECLQYGVVGDVWNQPLSDNHVVERYVVTDPYRNQSFSLYTWFEGMNYDLKTPKGICPDGWHIPTKPEWQLLYAKYPMIFIAKHLGENGLSGINLQNGSAATISFADSICSFEPDKASYISSFHYYDAENVFYGTYLRYQKDVGLVFSHTGKGNLDGTGNYQFIQSVRCIKDSE